MVDAQMGATLAGGAAEAIGGERAARAAMPASNDTREHWELVRSHLEHAEVAAKYLDRRNFAEDVREGIEYALTHVRVRLSLAFPDEVRGNG